jgi:hypothetical protein
MLQALEEAVRDRVENPDKKVIMRRDKENA